MSPTWNAQPTTTLLPPLLNINMLGLPAKENIMKDHSIDTYDLSQCAWFTKIRDKYGAFSNMSALGVVIDGVKWKSTEALYQALRFPDYPDVQKIIWESASPMSAKMKSKPHRKDKCRPDWADVEISVMEWCLRMKTSQNWGTIYWTLKDSGTKPIVEVSTKKDRNWGTCADDKSIPNIVNGKNVLGKLWMKIREEIFRKSGELFGSARPDLTILEQHFIHVPAPNVTNMTLFGKPLHQSHFEQAALP